MKRLALLLMGLSIVVTACADAATVGSGDQGSGIRGTVLLAPMCPVEQAASPCPGKPIEADITVTAADGTTIATGRSGSDGTYRIALPPGSYTVTATRSSGQFGAGKPTNAVVSRGTFLQLNLLVDSGIR